MEQQLYDIFHKIEDTHWWFQARKDIVLSLIARYSPVQKEKRILDVGCGTGGMLKELAKYGSVWGLDKNKKAIEYSSQKVPEANLMVGTFPEHMPEGNFDLIVALDILEHIEQDRKALQRLGNALSSQGIVVITVPAYRALWTSHDDANQHRRRYTRAELKQKVLDADLEILKISYYNTFLFIPIVLRKLINRFSPQDPASPLRDTSPPAWVNSLLHFVFSLEKHILNFMNFPFGVSLIVIASKPSKHA